MTDLEFIKEFQNIKICYVCKKLGISQANLTKGKCSKENIEKVKKEIIKEFAKLLTKI